MTLFAFADYFPAVATTDLVGRVADVLCAKPSELAFYPIPKLNIRRVGDHEAISAALTLALTLTSTPTPTLTLTLTSPSPSP